MSKVNVRRHVLEKNRKFKEKEKPGPQSFLSKHWKKIYPIGLPKSSSLSSVSLCLSQTSNDSSTADSISLLEKRITLSLRRIMPQERKEVTVANDSQRHKQQECGGDQGLKRCSWITKNSDKVYVEFHDERWGVPVYDDNQLFELLSISGMLMDYNYTEILKRNGKLREAFDGFDPLTVAQMEEAKITEIASNKELMLAESRVRCIVNNAKCITAVVKEFGSLSSYLWDYLNHAPVINRYKHPKSVPLRTPRAEAISRDLLRRGFRLVGPVIVYSFMQATGMTMDHLVDCFRHSECANLAEAPWNIFCSPKRSPNCHNRNNVFP